MNTLPKILFGTDQIWFCKALCKGLGRGGLIRRWQSRANAQDSPFGGNKVLILSKMSRYEFERKIRPEFDEDRLKEFLLSKGSDYKGLLERHRIHNHSLKNLIDALQCRGFAVKVVHRINYTEELISWADVVFTAGGDGTFLLAASRVTDPTKPVIGFNTDIDRSEGRLLLPSQYSSNPGTAIDSLLRNDFTWLWRQRIRVTTSGRHLDEPGMELQELQFRYPEFRYHEHVHEHEQHCNHTHDNPIRPDRQLPVRALNEVFVGESLSARVSYYEMSIDGGESSKQKSSGVTVTTGTGSSSWYFHINHLSHEAVAQVLAAARSAWPALSSAGEPSPEVINKIRDMYNSQVCFPPEEERMAFTIRDPLVSRVFSVTRPRGFVNKMTIRSRMWDGQLVIDGGTVFHFNDGAIASFQIFPEDALKCVSLN